MFETGTGTIGKGKVDITGTEMVGTAELSDAVICAAVGVLLNASAEIAGVTGVEISGVWVGIGYSVAEVILRRAKRLEGCKGPGCC